MNMEYLRTFFATVKYGSISKAAIQLHMSQPGVSIQIQALEKELGVSLLTRSNKGVELTDEGQVVYDHAVSILSITDKIERQLDHLKNKQTEIVVSSCTTIGSYALPCSLYTFRENNPNINVLLDITNSASVIKKVLAGSTKMGIIEGNSQIDGLKQTKITSDNLKLVVSPKRFKKPEISLDEFLKIPLILREVGSGTRSVICEALSKAQNSIEQVNVALELGSPEAIKSTIVAGKGFSIFSQLAIKKELATGTLKEVQITGLDFISDYFLIHADDYKLNNPEKEFFGFLKSRKRGFC